MNYHIPLVADNYYHLFSRAVGQEMLFKSNENYLYFLERMKHHVLPVADLLAYSLLPNHFHLVIRVKSEKELFNLFHLKKKKPLNSIEIFLPDFVMEQFSNWLNGYTKAFNKLYKRKGGLFMDYIKRSEAAKDSSLTSFIFYVHKNAVHHGLTKNIGDWKFDSYKSIISTKPTKLKRDEVIGWFGSVSQFIEFHKQPVDLKYEDIDSNL